MRIDRGTCRDVLPALSADAVVTDPPYGINFAGDPTKWRERAGHAPEEWDLERFSDIELIVRAAPKVCVWGGNYYELPPSRGWLVWVKPDAPPTMSSVEMCWTSLDMNSAHIIHSIAATNKERLGHPTQKPLPVIKWSIGRMGISGGVVLDPFCGSGTTLRAALDLGLGGSGIEIEERYCEMAAKRMSQRVLAI